MLLGIVTTVTLSEQLAHSAVDLHLEEISEFLHGSEMNKNYAVRKLHLSQPKLNHFQHCF